MSNKLIIRDIIRNKGWHELSNGYFGHILGFESTINYLQDQEMYLSMFPVFDQGIDWEELKTVLENSPKKHKSTEINVLDHGIHITFKNSIIAYKLINRISITIREIETFLTEKNISEKLLCIRCKNEKPLKAYTLNNHGHFFCTECFEYTNKELTQVKDHYDSLKGNYIKAFFGSIFFSIPGIILWFIFQKYLGVISTLTSIVIVYSNIKGYQYFSGKFDKYTKLIILIANIISVSLGGLFVFIAASIDKDISLQLAWDYILHHKEVTQSLFRFIGGSLFLSIFVGLFFLPMVRNPKIGIFPAKKY